MSADIKHKTSVLVFGLILDNKRFYICLAVSFFSLHKYHFKCNCAVKRTRICVCLYNDTVVGNMKLICVVFKLGSLFEFNFALVFNRLCFKVFCKILAHAHKFLGAKNRSARRNGIFAVAAGIVIRFRNDVVLCHSIHRKNSFVFIRYAANAITDISIITNTKE